MNGENESFLCYSVGIMHTHTFRLRRVAIGVLSLSLSLASLPAFAVSGGNGPGQVPVATLGGNATIDYAYRSSGGVFTDVTAAANSTTANDVTVGSNLAADVLYVGMKSPFDTIYLDVGTWGVGSAGALQFAYGTTVAGLGGNVVTSYSSLNVTSASGDTNLKTAVSGGMTTLTFTPPVDFAANAKVNGVQAYWVRITTSGGYTTPVKANQLRTRAYNAVIKLAEQYSEALWITALAPSSYFTCTSSQYYGEWNVGNGIHYYALRTDGGNCTMFFDPPNFGSAGISINNLTTTLSDWTLNAVHLPQNIEMRLYDEVGNSIPDATVAWNGMPIAAGTGTLAGTYYATKPVGVAGKITVTRVGYVTEDVVNGINPVYQNVVPSEVGIAYFDTFYGGIGSVHPPCSSVNIADITFCTPLRRDAEIKVMGGGAPVVSAAVTVYTDAGMTVIADDESKIGQTKDASGTSDGSGFLRAALASGTYTYTVSAAGYAAFTGTAVVTSGKLNSFTAALTPGVNPVMNDPNPSASQSSVSIAPAIVAADGTSAATVTVTVRNAGGQPLMGKSVTLVGVLFGLTVTPSAVMTDASGVAKLAVRSTSEGAITISAFADSTFLTQSVSVQFSNSAPVVPPVQPVVPPSDPSVPPAPPVEGPAASCQQSITSGKLVKLPDDADPSTQADTAVYYIGTDCKRHAFPNSKVYFSWYTDFAGVTVVSSQTMASFSLGKAVNYRPGIKMVKFQSLNTVYVVAKGGVLRWVKTEAAASGLYGSDWNKKVDDISDAFFTNYAFGTDVNASAEFVAATEQAAAPNISQNF